MSAVIQLPALHATHGGIWLATAEGTRVLARGEASAQVSETPTLILNAPLVAARLGLNELSGLDLLELYAFVHPARFAVPTAAGLARALGLEPPQEGDAAAEFLRRAADALLAMLERPVSATPLPNLPHGRPIARAATLAMGEPDRAPDRAARTG